MRKIILAGFLASVAVFPALAQQQQAPAPTPSDPPAQRMETPATPPATTTRTETTTMTTTAAAQWRASKLVGVDVYNTANEKIGDIDEVLIDSSGKVAGVIISVGGFLGMGTHDVMVQLSDLKFVNEPMTRTSTAPATTTTSTATTGTTTRSVRATTEKWYPDHAIMNASKDQLKTMPAFKYN